MSNSGDISAVSYFGGAGISGDLVVGRHRERDQQRQHLFVAVHEIRLRRVRDRDVRGRRLGIDNSSGIEVVSAGAASVWLALSFAGDAHVTNSGDLSRTYSNAARQLGGHHRVRGERGDAHVENSRSVDAGAKYWASGVDARAYGDVTVSNSGTLAADGRSTRSAYASVANGDVMVHNENGGESAFSYLGRGWGVFGYAARATHARGQRRDDRGLRVRPVGGRVRDRRCGQRVGGQQRHDRRGERRQRGGGRVARADYGTASVTNSGDITASNFGGYYTGYSAYGVFARGAYAEVANSGSITAEGYYYATGIAASSYHGTTVVATAASDVERRHCWSRSALSAFGIRQCLGDQRGDVTVEGVYGGGVGIQAYSGLGNVTAANSRQVLASSTTARRSA